jgi:hypothetical protein
MKLVKAQIYAKVADPTKGLYVFVEDVGWLHIAKLPFDYDNIFFSKEEIELVVGGLLTLMEEFEVDDTTERMVEWKRSKGIYAP